MKRQRPTTTDHSTDTRVLLALRLYVTPVWKFPYWLRTSLALDRVKDKHERAVNDWAAVLRTQGYTIPVGTILYGEKVTR